MSARIVLVACCLWLSSALGQEYPARPITLVVPYPSGSVPDLVARAVAEKLALALGQAVRVEPRPGSNGNIGAAVVARSPPDGYTLLFCESALLTVNPLLYRNPPFNAERDFAPVFVLGESPAFLAVNAALQIGNLGELVDHARRISAPLAYASPGVGTQFHVLMERFRRAAGIELLHVPYRAGPLAVAAAIGGDVAAVFAGTQVLGFVHAGRLKSLAVSSATRSRAMPEVPSLSEHFKGLETTFWQALFAPAATPVAVLERLELELERLVTHPELARRLAGAFDLHPLPLTRLQFAELVRRERDLLRQQWPQLGIFLE